MDALFEVPIRGTPPLSAFAVSLLDESTDDTTDGGRCRVLRCRICLAVVARRDMPDHREAMRCGR